MIDDTTKELIALGASVACNCHPCVKYHTEKAKKLGISPDLIAQAASVGKMVRGGAASEMDELLESLS